TSSYAMLSINERIRWIFEQSELGYGRPTENEEELVRRFQIAIQLRNQKVQQLLKEEERKAKVLTDFRHRNSIRKAILALSRKTKHSEQKISTAVLVAAVFYRKQGYQVITCTSDIQDILDLVDSPRSTLMRGCSSVSLVDEFEGMNFSEWVCQEMHEAISSLKAVVHFTDKSQNFNPASKAIEDSASIVGDSFRQKNLSYYWVPISRDEKVLTVLKKHFVGMEAIELRSSDALVEKILQDAYRRFRNAQVEICGIPNFTVATATPDLGAPDWKDAAAEDFQYHAIGVPASIQSIVDGSELSRTVFSVQVKKSARPFALQGLVAEYFALLKEGEAAWHKATVREFLVSDLKNTFKQPFVLLNTCEILQVATFLFQEFNRLNKIVRVVKPFTTAVIIPRTRRAGLDPALLCPFRFEKKLAGANQFEIIDDDWNPGEVTSANPVESDCRGAAGTGNSSSKQASSGNPEKHCFSASQRFKLIFTRCSKTLSDEASEALIKSAKIHCSDVTRFLPWNLGKSGIRRYLQKHECNDLCKKMGLRRVFMNM
uniref:Alpha-type protein kinase domain-containing protein n=1 Tax=Macrostomum lignano TaxID=282301 RepID=A0A1I8JD27_9PLAT